MPSDLDCDWAYSFYNSVWDSALWLLGVIEGMHNWFPKQGVPTQMTSIAKESNMPRLPAGPIFVPVTVAVTVCLVVFLCAQLLPIASSSHCAVHLIQQLLKVQPCKGQTWSCMMQQNPPVQVWPGAIALSLSKSWSQGIYFSTLAAEMYKVATQSDTMHLRSMFQ